MENNEVSIEEVFKDDDEAIKWLNSIDNPKFKNTLNALYSYAQKCLSELDKKDLSEGLDEENKGKIITRVKDYITNQENFRQRCLIESSDNGTQINELNQQNFRLGIFAKEEIELIQTLTEEDIKKLSSDSIEQNDNKKELISKIRKANRFYNMQQKLAHTARIVRVADEVLNQFKGNMNPYLKEMVMTSSLLHDIGRFYQAQEFDDFTKEKELIVDKNNNLSGHSKAGYYYSIMDLYRMNFFGDEVDKELLIKTATGFVVSYHSKSNYDLAEDGVIVEEENLLEEFDQNSLKKLIGKLYSDAEYIKFSEDEIGQEKFIEKFMKEMLLERGLDSLQALQIDEERIKQTVENISKELENGFIERTNSVLKDYNRNEQTESQNKSIEEISEELKEAISKGANMEFDENDIKNTLINMANYDVAESIYQMFGKEENIEEKKLMQTLFAFPTNIVTDADKIDIFNQLATGTYPFTDTYNPNKYTVYSYNGNKREECGEEEKEKAFKLFNSEQKEKEVIILKSDKDNFAEFNGLKGGYVSPVRSTLWLINQFIFTNMRNKTSIDIIKDNRFIEKTYEQFGKEERIQEILKPYIAYTLFFMDYVSDKEYNLLSKDIMQELCKEVSSIYKENDMLREEYEALFDGDLIENREKFFEEKNNQPSKVITTMQIGKTTINAPTTAKMEAEQVENSEIVKDNTKEGEEVDDDN